MSDLILSGPATKRMTSLEVSELVESRHDKVKQSIERLAKRGIIELPPMGEISTSTKPVSVYLLDKRSSLIVVAQLSPEFTARVVDRWQELEAQAEPRAIHNEGRLYTVDVLAARWRCGVTSVRRVLNQLMADDVVIKHPATPGFPITPAHYQWVNGEAPHSRPSFRRVKAIHLQPTQPTTAPSFQKAKPYQANSGFMVPFGAMIITAEQIPALIADQKAIVPRELLPEIISAATVRLVGSI